MPSSPAPTPTATPPPTSKNAAVELSVPRYRAIRGYALIAEVLSRSAVPIAVLPRTLLSSLVKSSVRRQPLIYKAARNAPAWYVTARPGLRYVRLSAQGACANATRADRVSQEQNRRCTSWLVPGDARTAR